MQFSKYSHRLNVQSNFKVDYAIRIAADSGIEDCVRRSQPCPCGRCQGHAENCQNLQYFLFNGQTRVRG